MSFPPDTGLDTKIVDIFGYQNPESVNFQGNYKQKKILGYQIKYLQNIRILNMDQIRFPDTRLKIRIPKFWKLVRNPHISIRSTLILSENMRLLIFLYRYDVILAGKQSRYNGS